MFKTDDRVIQICLFLTGLIFMLYAGMMAFNTGAFLDRYPTFDNDATNRFFVVWFGLNNIMFLAGIYYMGYKGLDKGYFVFLIPASILNIVWIVMSHQATGGENYTGLTMVSIGLLLTLIARYRSGMPFSWQKTDTAWGTSDGLAKAGLYGLLILQVLVVIGYFVDPNSLMNNNPDLTVTTQGSHFALGLFFLSLCVILALVYQYYVGFSGVLISMGQVWQTIFMSILLANVITSQGDMSQGDPLLALGITLGFIFNTTVFFRLQKSF